MRLAVLADIHGNLPALEAVIAEVQRQGIDAIIVAGDFAGGPQPLETVRLLRRLDSWLIRGNREDYLLAYDSNQVPDAWRTSDQWVSLRWMYQRLDRESLDYIAALPEQGVFMAHGVAPIRVLHGSPESATTLLVPGRGTSALERFRRAGLLDLGYRQVSADEVLRQVSEPVLICGHSHIAWQQVAGNRLILNPGSVGAPLNGDVRAQYALLAWHGGRWRAELRAVAYDLERVRAAYRETGLLSEGGPMARAFLRTVETGHNVVGRLVTYFFDYAAQAGYEERYNIPDAVWEEAVESFDWEAADQPEYLDCPGCIPGRSHAEGRTEDEDCDSGGYP
jgi:predicted phosphodiesterase